jgi:DNA-binding XRE family transcriptional regulator
MSEILNNNTELIDFEVRVPNLEGDGIAEVHIIKVPARRSKGGGDFILTDEAFDLIEQTQSRYMGLMSPGDIKKLRTRIRFTQRQMSELIQAGEKSYTRWETGRARLSRLVNIILCGIRDGYLPLPYLQTLCKEGSDWYKKVLAFEVSKKGSDPYQMVIPLTMDATCQPTVSQSPSLCAGAGVAWRDSWFLLISHPVTNYSY